MYPDDPNRTPTTLSVTYPNDIVIQYIMRPTVWERPIPSISVVVLLELLFMIKCDDILNSSASPTCARPVLRTHAYVYFFIVAMFIYTSMKKYWLRRRHGAVPLSS